MSRGGRTIKKRVANLDPVYNSKLVTKLINKSMKDGKKSVARTQVYRALELLKEKFAGEEPGKLLEQALNAVAPKMEVRSRRVGGASYQVPSEVRGERRMHLALKWVIEGARTRSNKEFHTFAEKLAAEVSDVLSNTGNAIKKRDQVQKMAEANRAFAHLRW